MHRAGFDERSVGGRVGQEGLVGVFQFAEGLEWVRGGRRGRGGRPQGIDEGSFEFLGKGDSGEEHMGRSDREARFFHPARAACDDTWVRRGGLTEKA